VSHDHSRKQFLASLLGLTAVAAVVAKVSAKPGEVAPVSPAAGVPIKIRSDDRSVARRDGAA
jgi:hypothetical protein